MTLRCDVISGHPPQLIRVRWLKDGTPFFETAASVLELSPVNKSLSGAYQCLALNAAGWSELSEDARPLTVMCKYKRREGFYHAIHLQLTSIKPSYYKLRLNDDEKTCDLAAVFSTQGKHISIM